MKQNLSLQQIQENMKPGSLSAHGFLGDDTRNLADIIAEDAALLERLDITSQALAERMEYFTQQGEKSLGSPVTIDGIYEVVVEDSRGLLPCPFRDSYNSFKRNTTVINLKSGRKAVWSDLNIHMIKSHGFFEGRGSYFRINPEELAAILGISR